MKNKFIERLKQIIQDNKQNKKVKDILPNKSAGVNLLNAKNPNEMIDLLVEEPLRKACKTLRDKGIETIMSSANRDNVLQEGEKPVEKEDVKGQEYYLDSPTFKSAGKGYAWIMINYENLSDENKEILFSIEETKNSRGENIGEKIVWFVESTSVLYHLAARKDGREKSDLEKKFDERSFILSYNYRQEKAVFLRMPINQETTVTEVEEYFEKLVERLKQQELEINRSTDGRGA